MIKINFPSKDEITQILVENLVGSDKKIDDLSNQWFIKHLIISLREVIYMFVVILKTTYNQFTIFGATGEKLTELGYSEGVERKESTKAIHSVTLKKSSPVSFDYLVPDGFLLTTTPNNEVPIQFRVITGQNKKILAGQSIVTGVLVQCTEVGEIGNVSPGSINLIAQAGLDEVSDSLLVEPGRDEEDDESYRNRIWDKKRNPQGGGTKDDYKIWAESVDGVVNATVFPRNRGPGTVDILIYGSSGIPSQSLIDSVQTYINSKIPADLADGGVLVTGGTPTYINVTLTSCTWQNGYTLQSGKIIVENVIKDYINSKANKDRIIRFTDLIMLVKNAYDPDDKDEKVATLDFDLITPTTNISLANMETAVVGQISIS